MDQAIGLSLREALGILTLILSLGGNVFQLYRQRVYTRTIYNGLVDAFNSIGWLLARCINRTQELNERVEIVKRDTSKAGEYTVLKEFRDYSLETEWKLRILHEQLVAPAKTLKTRDERWQAGEFGYTREELEKIRKAFTEAS